MYHFKIIKIIKKIIIFITVVVGIVAIGFVACSSLEKENGEQAFVLDRAAIEQVGIMHNQYLDTILLALSKERIRLFTEKNILRNANSEENFEDIAYKTVIKTVKELNAANNASYNDGLIEKMVNKIRFASLRSSNNILDEANAKLTPFQQSYYDEIMAILDTKGITIDEFKKKIFDLEEQIEKESPTIKDAELLLCATAIARYSSEYWEQNAAKWNSVLNSEIIAVTDDKGNYRESSKLRSTSTYNPCNITPSVTPLDVTGSYGYEGLYAYPFCPAAYIQVIKLGDSYYAYLFLCPQGLLWDDNQKVCAGSWSFNWGEFAKADVAGGIAGGIGALFSFGTTAAGGAVVTSSADAITQFLDHWF